MKGNRTLTEFFDLKENTETKDIEKITFEIIRKLISKIK